ncbi:glycoside hydrolase family 88 protein [Paenibacillus sp. TRM 82003]|nr:glycoside hydrolase family 88 protein [Paenibacillus sp. TRM 82003]
MTSYIQRQQSIGYWLQDRDEDIVRTIAEHYIGNNPAIPFQLRAFHRGGALQTEDGGYDLDFAARFPDAANGNVAYAACLVWSDSERSIDLRVTCGGPVELSMNGARLYRSNAVDEVKREHVVIVPAVFAEGWNTLFVKAWKTKAGFGCGVGADEAKVRILHVQMPFQERAGEAGWLFSAPVATDRFSEGAPDLFGAEDDAGLEWFPKASWPSDAPASPFERLFGVAPGKKAYAWSRLQVRTGRESSVKFRGRSAGPFTLWVDGRHVMEATASGDFAAAVSLPPGSHEVLVESVSGANAWDWTCCEAFVSGEGDACEWAAPVSVKGYAGAWFYLGPLASQAAYGPSELQRLDTVFAPGDGSESLYWQLDRPETWIRPYYENAYLSNKWTTSGATNFARWDYPLGVTMYGLLRAGRLLARREWIDYALSHIKACTDFYEYSLWDRERYGFPSVNQQLVLLKMLDNCGSFGSAMLEASNELADEAFDRVAERIASFIRDRLERREDGAFYRICAGEYSENSMWADDLYMSTPFMRRYAQRFGDDSFLREAARQFLLYKKYLYMPDQKIMSHVYDFKYDTATGVPWGRGNGWVVFSLSELLEALPATDPDRPALLAFFNDLCAGYLALQGDDGRWHQVLNDPASYEESSCTAMFVYAFSRGVTYGWLERPAAYAEAALRGWRGLTDEAIDRHGNVYGVCSGSRYSFTPEYYKEELRTVTNDNHGIGIVMLAGVEVCRLRQAMTEEIQPVRGSTV